MNSISTYIHYIALHFRRHTHTVDLKRDWKPQFYTTEPSNIEFKMYKSFLYFISLISGSFTHQYWGCREVSIWDMNNTFNTQLPEQIKPHTRTTCRHSLYLQRANVHCVGRFSCLSLKKKKFTSNTQTHEKDILLTELHI